MLPEIVTTGHTWESDSSFSEIQPGWVFLPTPSTKNTQFLTTPEVLILIVSVLSKLTDQG